MTDKATKVDFFANGMCYHCHMAVQELQEYLVFHEESESSWKEKDKQLQYRLDDILKEHKKEQHEDIIDSHSWELHQNQYKFPNIHRESLVITIYNFVESELNRLCSIIAESIDTKIKLKDLSGQGINRALLYLLKVAEFDMSKMGAELPYIKKVNLLRNTIVHNGSLLPDREDHELNIFVSTNPNLSGQPGNSVSLRPEFIGELIGILIDFFDKLDTEIQAFMGKANT